MNQGKYETLLSHVDWSENCGVALKWFVSDGQILGPFCHMKLAWALAQRADIRDFLAKQSFSICLATLLKYCFTSRIMNSLLGNVMKKFTNISFLSQTKHVCQTLFCDVAEWPNILLRSQILNVRLFGQSFSNNTMLKMGNLSGLGLVN